MALRHAHPVFRRRSFFQGRPVHGSEVKDISWFRPDGSEMSEQDWNQSFVRTLGVRLAGEALGEVDDLGNPITDDTFLLLMNAWWEEIPFALPEAPLPWERVFDTSEDDPFAPREMAPEENYPLLGRSLALFRVPRAADPLP